MMQKNDFSLPVRAEVEPMRAYPPGMTEEEVRERFGVERVVKLASNENPLGPSPKALAALKQAEGFDLHRYIHLGALRRALAAAASTTDHPVEPGEILLGNGSDEIILLMALTFLGPDTNIVTAWPEFVRYRMAAQLVGAEVIEVPMTDEWRHDVDVMLDAVDGATRAVFVASPTNPVGTMLTHDEVERLAAGVGEKAGGQAMLVLDQAYHEYASGHPDYPRTAELRARYPDVVALRTFSKAYGLAGLRLGYGLAHPDIVAKVERVRPPFNINKGAMHTAMAALGDEAHLRATVELNEAELPRLATALGELGLDVAPSFGNFVWADVDPAEERGLTGMDLFNKLLERGIVVRPMAGYGYPRHVRISVGTAAENDALLAALAETL